MSWFDTAGITSFAKSALNTAQKTIDKALDIKEEHKTTSSDKKSSKKAEGDSFFEAFGLGEEPSTSKCQEKENDTPPDMPRDEGSGFWTETWGSIFEMKGNAKPDSEDKGPVENISQSDGNAVLSQPHRESLFPKEPHSLLPQDFPPKSVDIKTVDQKEDVIQIDDKKDTSVVKVSKTSIAETQNASSPIVFSQEHVSLPQVPSSVAEIVTMQPSSIPIQTVVPSTSSHVDTLVSTPSVPVQSTSPSASLVVEQIIQTLEASDSLKSNVDELNCGAESKEGVSLLIVPSDLLDDISESSIMKPSEVLMDQSEFLNIEMPLEQRLPVIEDQSEKICGMQISSGSFTQLESSEVDIPSFQSEHFGESITLDLPGIVVAESIVNWECSGSDSLPPQLFASEVSIHEDTKVSPNQIPLISAESSFHTIDVESFSSSSRKWSKASSHSIDESQNSSNENSHHSDGSSNSSKDDDDTDTTGGVKDCDGKSSSSGGSHTTSSSFVKCSIEENDGRGQSPSSTSASDRSDVTKQESEHNFSGDEAETATSSDIEILSPPNGERNVMKQGWVPRPYRLRHSESPTSDSSKDSVMPVVSELEEVSCEDEPSDEKEDLECHKNYEGNLESQLLKEAELQTRLEAREKKLLELSKENVELQENEERLKKLVHKMRVDQEKESKDISSLTREFTQKLAHVETQLKETIQERNSLHLQLDETKEEISKRISASDVEDVIKDKDQQIKELLEEGAKLSKKELQHSTIIKKLRAKKEELEQTTQSQEKKIEENSKEVERLRKSIFAKEDQEKKHIDAIRDLTNTVTKLDKELSTFKSDHEDSLEKERSLKTSLDSTYKDLTDLRKAYATKEIEVQELKSGLELKANENLQQMLETSSKEASREKDMLLSQMQDLRYSMSQSEKEANQREKSLRDEITCLQKRLQEAEGRNEDLSKNMSAATRPLVRQMENLQATFTAQTISWEKIEKNLTDRLADAQSQVALIMEKERAMTERYMEFQSKVRALESHNGTLRQEKLQLSAEIETLKANIVVLEENIIRESYTVEKTKQNFNSEISRLKQEKANVDSTMSTCLEQLDLEKRKVQKLEEEIRMKEARALMMTGSSPCPSPTGSARSSVSSIHNWAPPDEGTVTPVNSYRMSVYDSLRLGSGSSLLENLQSQLKQREGEILQLQSEICKLEHVKESMTRELVALTEQNEDLDKRLVKLEAIDKEYSTLNQKYNTLLQMYGEKVEETEELHLDLADVKSMYKAQIEELLKKK